MRYTSSTQMVNQLMDLRAPEDGSYSPNYTGHMVGDTFLYKGVPTMRLVDGKLRVRQRMLHASTKSLGFVGFVPSTEWSQIREYVPGNPSTRNGHSYYRLRAGIVLVSDLDTKVLAAHVTSLVERALCVMAAMIARWGVNSGRYHMQNMFVACSDNLAAAGLPRLTSDYVRTRMASAMAMFALSVRSSEDRPRFVEARLNPLELLDAVNNAALRGKK
jgi:hypothetical protein